MQATTENSTTLTNNKTAAISSAEYECEYYHPTHDQQIIAASTKTLEVNGEEVSAGFIIYMVLNQYILKKNLMFKCQKVETERVWFQQNVSSIY